MSAEYQVPRILWESLESVLMAQGRQFVKECAKRLEVNEKELLKRVMPSSKISVYLQDTHSDTLQCKAFINVNSIIHHCRRPVALGCEYCYHHRRDRLAIEEPDSKYHIERLQDAPDRPTLWKRSDNTVIDSQGNTVGIFDTDSGKLTLYTIDEDA
jgi:hypothetical protein